MIDIHSHILPGIDDGAKSWEETLSMCQIAWQNGTKTIVATPHMFNGVWEPDLTTLPSQLAKLREMLREHEIGLDVALGAEVHCRPDLPELLEREPALTLDGNKRYFLLEFPHSVVPPNASQLIFELTLKNFIPIIAHPERNTYIQENVDFLVQLVRQGALYQITAMSVTGEFGTRAFECVRKLLENDCVHMVASDAHGCQSRRPVLRKAREEIAKHLGCAKAEEMFEILPGKVLAGESVDEYVR